jgi:Ca2+ transporting ATPase
MASVTTVCTDKTGTLTTNDQRVVALQLPGAAAPAAVGAALVQLPAALRDLLALSVALNTSASLGFDAASGAVVRSGNKTECGLLAFADEHLGLGPEALSALRRRLTVLETRPFTSDRKRAAVLLQATPELAALLPAAAAVPGLAAPGARALLVMGGAEVVLQRCTRQLLPGGGADGGGADGGGGELAPLGETERDRLLGALPDGGLRVLALAYKPLRGGAGGGGEAAAERQEDDLALIALVGLRDPLRPEVPAAVAACARAGIAVRMLTGDNAATAAAVARAAGILPPPAAAGASNGDDARGAVMEGAAFRAAVTDAASGALDDDAFCALWPRLRVVARCSPGDKFLLVDALRQLRARGRLSEVVAMTGDGTNDAPSLAAADVGFAFASGTAIARGASDIQLLDDSFISVVKAVAWGRAVYANISRFLQFQLTASCVAVAAACGGALLSAESPLSSVQLLWLNMLLDSLGALALATEPPDAAALLAAPPVDAAAPLITPTMRRHILGQAAYQLAALAGLQALYYSGAVAGPGFAPSDDVARTLLFNSLVAMSLFNQLNCRRVADEPNVTTRLLAHPAFLAIVAGEAGLQALIVQNGGAAFSTVPLDAGQWAACVGLGASTLLVRRALVRPGGGGGG